MPTLSQDLRRNRARTRRYCAKIACQVSATCLTRCLPTLHPPMKKRSSTHRSTASQPGESAPHRASAKAPNFELLPDLAHETPHAEPRHGTELELETVRIGYFNPDARAVFVAGSFNNWETNTLAMERDDTGNWSVELSLPSGEYRYRLVVDGEWRDHPGAARLVASLCEGNDAVIMV